MNAPFTLPKRKLLRAACDIFDCWQHVEKSISECSESQLAIFEQLTKKGRARIRHLASAVARPQPLRSRDTLLQWLRELAVMSDQARILETTLRAKLETVKARYRQQELVKLRPTPRMVYHELFAVAFHFPSLQIDELRRALSVTTAPIVLEEVDFGPFTIELKWNDIWSGVTAYEVRPEKPFTLRLHESVPHPHVRSRKLCEGEAQQPIQRALQELRLLDFFQLVLAVLENYNPDSPHISLSRWKEAIAARTKASQSPVTCCDCGHDLPAEEIESCDECGGELCSDCLSSCESCGRLVCSEHRYSCDQCGETRCEEHSYSCAGCDDIYCNACFYGGDDSLSDFCQHCREEDEEDEEDEEEVAEEVGG